jgi:integrase/recombinase XerD
MLETMYSAGLRRSEIARLEMSDVDFKEGLIVVHTGKEKRVRRIPIGRRALYWIEKYINQARPVLLCETEQKALFINRFGEAICDKTLSHICSAYIKAANLGKRGSCQAFRHTMATLMLENGADLRYVQNMLGHTRISTTEVYTKISIAKLKEIHHRTHPARMNPTKTDEVLGQLEENS